MRLRRAVVIQGALVLLAAGSARAQVVRKMTPDLLRAAIKDERAEGCYKIRARGMMPTTFGCFTTPYSRVAMAAQYAKRRYQAFSEADVTPDLIAPEFHVYAYPQDAAAGAPPPGKVNVAAIVLLPKDASGQTGAIRPSASEEISLEYKNLLGATFEGRGLRAVFPLDGLSEDYEVRFVYGGEYADKGCVTRKESSDCPGRLILDKVW